MLTEDQVVIVGGGATGLTVADELTARGIACTVLEAGPLPSLPTGGGLLAVYRQAVRYETAPDDPAWRYRTEGLAGEWPRVRAAGGRTLLWGGWCERFSAATLRDARLRGIPWPVTLSELAPWYRHMERRFQVRTGRPGASLRAIGPELGVAVRGKRGAVGPGGQRVRVALDLRRARRTIRAGAVALRVLCDPRGRARSVECLGADGERFAVHGRAVVLCASPVETVRLLLAGLPAGLENRALLGQGLGYHLVASSLVLVPEPATPTSGDLFGRSAFVPRFVNLGPSPDRDYVGGFSLEASGPVPAAELGPVKLDLLGLTPDVAAGMSFYAVHAMGEAAPTPERAVRLDPGERDAFGRPVPVIRLAHGPGDAEMSRDMNEAVLAVADALAPAGSRIIPFRDPRWQSGLFHESGGCRMGTSPEDSVTDAHGQVWGVPGLFVADASVLPTAGDRHPTLTLLALAARTAENVASRRWPGSC